MELREVLLEKLKISGVGHRKLDDDLFSSDKTAPRLGIYDEDDENLCHNVVKTTCNVPSCQFTADSLLEFENHYNAAHRYSCSQCKKLLPSPHLLDLHIQETHDSFFAVLASRKASYCCYIEECKDKFMTSEERRNHCVRVHRLPKDFRFDRRPRAKKVNKHTKTESAESMEVDKDSKFLFTNSKQKTFAKYSGKNFPNTKSSSNDVNMDDAMAELRNSLPE